MTKRNEYSKYKYIEGYSTKNEPLPYRYPDMKAVYDKFSKIFGLSKDNFILTNGCENALRIVLLALNIKSIMVETPGWELAKVIPESLGIDTKNIHLKFFREGIYEEPGLDRTELSTGDSAIYLTSMINNFVIHKSIGADENHYNRYMIFDETYFPEALMSDAFRSFLNDEKRKSIVIGSFSKIADPGMRLGYIIFNKIYNDRFQMLREQYISSEACKYILSLKNKHDVNIGKPEIIDDRINEYTVKTKVYSTFSRRLDTDYPYKQFKVPVADSDEYRTLYRYGIL